MGVFDVLTAPIRQLQKLRAAGPKISPDAPSILVQSVGRAALDATVGKGTLQPWADALTARVQKDGKFPKLAVLYTPVAPPGLFWEYTCRQCRFWEEPNGCKIVNGYIAKGGWCSAWLPPVDYAKPFTWLPKLPFHLMDYAKEAPNALRYWFSEPASSGGPFNPPSPAPNTSDVIITQAPKTPEDQIRTLRY